MAIHKALKIKASSYIKASKLIKTLLLTPVAAIMNFANKTLPGVSTLASIKNRKSIVWTVSGPNLVLLEESEPNSPFDTLTALIKNI